MQYTDMQKQTINTRKKTTMTKNHHILSIQMQIIYMDGECLKSYQYMVLIGKKYVKIQ